MYSIYIMYIYKKIKYAKNIDIDDAILTKLKLLAVFESNNVKGLMEEAVCSSKINTTNGT